MGEGWASGIWIWKGLNGMERVGSWTAFMGQARLCHVQNIHFCLRFHQCDNQSKIAAVGGDKLEHERQLVSMPTILQRRDDHFQSSGVSTEHKGLKEGTTST